jgi:hypothetical protein
MKAGFCLFKGKRERGLGRERRGAGARGFMQRGGFKTEIERAQTKVPTYRQAHIYRCKGGCCTAAVGKVE